MLADTRKSKYAKVSGAEYDQIKWTGGFWKDVVENCAESTVPHLQKMFEALDAGHVVENFRICAGEKNGEFGGSDFGDGDFYKWMESQLYSAEQLQDQSRLDKLDEYIDLIGRAQEEDGYISTKQIIGMRNGTCQGRLGDINEFEVYNMGHLFTSACLYKRITGKENFLDIARKAADFLENMYAEAEKKGEVQTAVCPSHYMGLVEMYRTTGEKKYLDLAHKAIVLRDSVKEGMDDNQDRLPLKEHEKIIGHAVRATYLYAGVADLYAEEGDKEYLDVLHKVWKNMVDTKIYLTGGVGALYNGASPYGDFWNHQLIHQAFGYEYQLPNVTAYNETCASIGLVMWAYRMFLIEPKAEYFDVIERALLNVNLAAVSLDGKKFFYENMLRRAKKLEYKLIWPLTRTEYLISYCCPPNLARMVTQSGEYAYTVSADSVYTGIYGECDAVLTLENGASFTLKQKTEYPYNGKIVFEFENVSCDRPVTLNLRIPKWAEAGSIKVGAEERKLDKTTRESYQAVHIEKLAGTRVELELEMPVRFTMAHPMVEEDSQLIAVEKGPLVYCMESPDADIRTLDDICINIHSTFRENKIRIKDREIGVLETEAYQILHEDYDPDELYQSFTGEKKKSIPVRLIPYFAWDNREYGEMRIWMPWRE
ncbi:MAG: hypothetical protein BHV92_02930 [Clostridiales bacterium 45_37]|nr:MAG: hypothetical protein BHV92_02930 [Clostridiales bacterium 45_37]